MDMDSAVRMIVSEAIANSAKSCQVIAEQMSYRLGKEVTEAMLRHFTAESARQHRFPLAWANALCAVTNDYRLLACIVERAGFRLVTAAEADVARKYLDREEAERALKVSTDAALAERSKK